ncbi:hypothetical protein CS063_13495 [Sporanaerobium hydrogeniformans]|uniref:Uncharacterized protein n=1 Tax=Sporanaerobium hydrogeniformans TaxID=3072179 RepID=A0AC61DAP8_9FIRM|nr:peptidoglycan DD-metalloendopeptidase family protein [Sporanaerobium hydrogeniformans]PHV69848.1 hypothetical protein CS063_13495 [Sporanaerobium hydrogeniformans]
MNNTKVGQFFKKYGFYIAVGVICIGALTAIFILPSMEGNVKEQANPYAANEAATGNDVKAQDEQVGDVIVEMEPEGIAPDASEEQAVVKEDEKSSSLATSEESKEAVEGVVPENFESTTATVASEPFFAKGDTFVWPVDGKVVVPYTDAATSHWYSESLNQTMRTFGVCIAAQTGENVKAVADGKVIDIVDDSTILEGDMPYVGRTMIIDNGNGYKTVYGFQGGTPNKDLLGKVVKAGDIIGTVGKPMGAFVLEGSNIYLQVMCNEDIVNPLEFLDYKQNASNVSVEVEGVDMGHTADAE